MSWSLLSASFRCRRLDQLVSSHHTHTHTLPFNGLWCGTTRVGQYQRKHSLTPILIIGHPLSSSSIYSDQWHPLCSFYVLDSPLVQPLQVLFGLPLGLGPSTSYSLHFFTQSSSFRSICPYQRSLFCCNTNAMSSIPIVSLSTLSLKTFFCKSFPQQPFFFFFSERTTWFPRLLLLLLTYLLLLLSFSVLQFLAVVSVR